MKQRSRAASPFGRRRFVSVLGAAGVAGVVNALVSAVGPGRALAQTGKSGGTPPATPPTTPPSAPGTTGAPAPPVISEEAKNLLAIVRGRYGTHLSDEQANQLLEALNNTVQAGQALRKKTLANSIEPDVIFRAEPPRDPGAALREGDGR